MSVAVSIMPAIPYMNGDSEKEDRLLDVLLASCQKFANKLPTPGTGRDLQPYFPNEQGIIQSSKKSKERKASPAKRAPKKASAPVPAPSRAANNKKGRASPLQASPAGSPQQSSHKKRTAHMPPSKEEKVDAPRPIRASSMPGPLKSGEKLPMTSASKGPAPILPAGLASLLPNWAGPGFCTAPTADQLPMPSSFLLA